MLLVLSGCDKSPALKLNGIDLENAKETGDFTLRDVQGRPRTVADFRGKVLIVLFGYTQCPDVCPTSLARAVEIKRLLGKQAENLQVIFITVDPERDTPEVLQAYTSAFDPSFIGLYGDAQQTAAAAKSYRAFYSKMPAGNSYAMEHTTWDYVIDAHGKLRMALRYEETAAECVSDLKQVM